LDFRLRRYQCPDGVQWSDVVNIDGDWMSKGRTWRGCADASPMAGLARPTAHGYGHGRQRPTRSNKGRTVAKFRSLLRLKRLARIISRQRTGDSVVDRIALANALALANNVASTTEEKKLTVLNLILWILLKKVVSF